jgi:TRAP-type transport system periplasmic protein
MHRFLLLPLGLAAVVTAAGCGGAHESKTGSPRAAHSQATELRLATFFGETGPLTQYADAVAHASGGTLRIREAANAHAGDPHAERKLIADVQAGRVPLAVVGARTWNTMGVRAFDPLIAPFLITSYGQQQRVLRAPVAGRMLASLDRLHLTGLALLPGPFRRMLGVHTTYLTAGDFRGTRVGIQDSRIAAETMRVLGATPVPVAPQGRVDQIDGYEQQLGAIASNGYASTSRAVTTNLALWTRPLVIFGNPDALARLTPAQRSALATAGTEIVPAASAALATEDRDAVARLCRAQFALKLAPPAGLRSIEQAVQPIYDALAADPTTRRAMAEIRALRGDDAEPQRASCAGGQITTRAETAFDGVYRRSSTAEQVAKQDHVPVADAVAENYGDFVLVIEGDRFAVTQHSDKACTWQYGRMSIAGDQMRWDYTDGGGLAPNNATNKPGEQFVLKPRLYRGTLTLDVVSPADLPTQIWQKTNTTASRSALDQRCHPPAEALPH